MAKKSKMQKRLEESIKLAKKRMLPGQIKQDSLGRRLKEEDDFPTALDDPRTLKGRRRRIT